MITISILLRDPDSYAPRVTRKTTSKVCICIPLFITSLKILYLVGLYRISGRNWAIVGHTCVCNIYIICMWKVQLVGNHGLWTEILCHWATEIIFYQPGCNHEIKEIPLRSSLFKVRSCDIATIHAVVCNLKAA